MNLTSSTTEGFARIALGHVTREYPHKADHVMSSDDDVYVPRKMHPIFYGSFDWHSCVHGYWLLARLRHAFPGLACAGEIDELFATAMTAEKVEAECRYLARASARGFERPYGWAWLLMLSAELKRAASPHARILQPLADAFVRRFHEYLPLLTYPVRAGTHGNTAFAMILTHRYAVAADELDLQRLVSDRARVWFLHDERHQVREPDGEDFLSPTLMAAVLMRHVLPAPEFRSWFERFLPGFAQGEPATLFTVPSISDPSDGKIGHLMGLALTRAWAFQDLAFAWSSGDGMCEVLHASAHRHLSHALGHLSDNYMGEHWLATFALLALDTEDWASRRSTR